MEEIEKQYIIIEKTETEKRNSKKMFFFQIPFTFLCAKTSKSRIKEAIFMLERARQQLGIQKAIGKKRLKYVKEEKLFILETLILYKY